MELQESYRRTYNLHCHVVPPRSIAPAIEKQQLEQVRCDPRWLIPLRITRTYPATEIVFRAITQLQEHGSASLLDDPIYTMNLVLSIVAQSSAAYTITSNQNDHVETRKTEQDAIDYALEQLTNADRLSVRHIARRPNGDLRAWSDIPTAEVQDLRVHATQEFLDRLRRRIERVINHQPHAIFDLEFQNN